MTSHHSVTDGVQEALRDTSYPSLWRRFFALAIDTCVLAIPVMAANRMLPYFGGFLIGFLYFPFLEASTFRATIGKSLVGVQVVTENRKQLPLKGAMIRYFAKVVSSMLLCIGHFLAFFTEKKQAFHDLLAGSMVVYGRSEEGLIEAWFYELKKAVQSFGVESSIAKIERLKALLDSGALTPEEFEAEKRKILEKS